MTTLPSLILPPLRHWINGEWVDSPGTRRAVVNPATQEVVAEVPQCTPQQLDEALSAASAAFPKWSSQTVIQRAQILKAWHKLILEHLEELVIVLSTEQGKPYSEARSELISAAAYVEWFAEEARRVYGEIVPQSQADKRMIVLRQPIGVVGAITPWNFPAGMVTRKVAPALAVGCTVVLKPASQAPLTALALVKLAEEAGLPQGVLNVVMGDADTIGRTFATDPRVKKLSFTGSTAVGQTLLGLAAPEFKRLSMELGGNAPFIIFEDANLDAAIDGVIASKFRNAGQTCVCTNRLYVHRRHYENVVDRVVLRAEQLRVGPAHQANVQMGPMIDAKSIDRAMAWVQEAVQAGATLRTGGTRLSALGPNFMAPTVLTNVTHEMRVVKDEVFAPILSILPFEDDESVIAAANSTPYGLSAYFYSENLRRVLKTAEALQFGMIGVNAPYATNESVPFGGVKHSGMGREGSRHGLDDFIDMKTVCLGGI